MSSIILNKDFKFDGLNRKERVWFLLPLAGVIDTGLFCWKGSEGNENAMP